MARLRGALRHQRPPADHQDRHAERGAEEPPGVCHDVRWGLGDFGEHRGSWNRWLVEWMGRTAGVREQYSSGRGTKGSLTSRGDWSNNSEVR